MVHPLQMAPKQTDPQFKLRLTPDLKDRIENSAAAAGRSMNAEILQRLEASFETSEQTRQRELVELLEENRRLRGRLQLWEPLVLQATKEELDEQVERLRQAQLRIGHSDAENILAGVTMPPEDLLSKFPSLDIVQRLFAEIRAAKMPDK